jgi:GNAT superfamily N-acetyltransferase
MLAIRQSRNAVPELPTIPGLVVRRELDARAMAAVQGRTTADMMDRFAAGHRAYVAYLEGEPAAFGWVATRVASIGELGTTFEIPSGARYLWNFVTLPAHRGKGIYPRLLDAIVRAESREADRFWIAHAPENQASGAGIRKAGFVTVAALSFDSARRPAMLILGESEASDVPVLGLPRVTEPLSRCWRCARAESHDDNVRPELSCADGPCACDYQRPDVGCASPIVQPRARRVA